MANVKILGDAAVVTSAMTLEQLQTLKKYKPKALQLMGGENGKEVVFMVDTVKGEGTMNGYGVSFGRVSRDEHKLAQLTMCIPAHVTDAKAWFVDTFGGAVANLIAVEEQVPAAIEEVNAARAAVEEVVSIA